MLNSVIRLSLRYRTLVLAVSLVVLVYGGYLTTMIPIDVFPDLDRPRVVILTECPGLSPEEVETLVTQPIETAILGASGVEAVRSQSSQGMNVIYVEFSWQTDIRYARQVVMERLATVPMPDGIRPQMTPPASIMGQILHVGLHRRKGPQGGQLAPVGDTKFLAELTTKDGKPNVVVWNPCERNRPETWEKVAVENLVWDKAEPGRTVTFTLQGQPQTATFRTPLEDRMDLRTISNWVIRPRLLKLPGIAEVIVMGGDVKQYQVLVNPAKLQEYNISLQDIEAAIKANNQNTSGGFLEEGQTERPVRVIGRLGPMPQQVVDDLLKVPVKLNSDRAVLLKQVADGSGGAGSQAGRRQCRWESRRRHHDRQAAACGYAQAYRRGKSGITRHQRPRSPPTSSSTPTYFSSRTLSTAGFTMSRKRWSSGQSSSSSFYFCSCSICEPRLLRSRPSRCRW